MDTTPMPRTRLKTFIRRRRWPLLAVGLALLIGGSIAAAVALAGTNAATDSLHIRGTLTLTDPDAGYGIYTQSCTGQGGYEDIRPGAQVAVTGPDGTVLAIGHLEAGNTIGGDGSTVGGTCQFAFDVSGVPAGHGLYGIEVSHRGMVMYEEAALLTVLDGPTLTLG
jgi:hypothetical protein